MGTQHNQFDLLSQLKDQSELIDSGADVRALGFAPSVEEPAPPDATRKFLVQTGYGLRAFVTCSSAGNPDLVARGVRNIAAIRGQLSPRIAEPVIEPLETGEVAGFSYAIWPMLTTFPERRPFSFAAKRWHAPRILDWVQGLSVETAAPMAPEALESLAADVILLAENSNLPGRVKQTAAETSEQLRLGRWRPVQTVQHSDLWMGNIMYAPRGSAWSFSVIDWTGATVNGFPFFDFCRFCLSCKTSAHLTRRKLWRLLAALELEHDAVVPHVLCSLARMQRNLEHFPEELFCEMVAQTTRFAFDLAEGAASDYRQG